MEEKQFNPNEVQVHRTLEGTLFEVVCGLVLVAAWVLVLLHKEGRYIATTSVGTVAVVYILLSCYRPKWFFRGHNMPKNMGQMLFEIRMGRLLACCLAGLFLLLPIIKHSHSDWMGFLFIGFMIVVRLYSKFRRKLWI